MALNRDAKRARSSQADTQRAAQRHSGSGGAGQCADYKPGVLGRPVILLPPNLDCNVLNIANGVLLLLSAGESQADACTRRQDVFSRRRPRALQKQRIIRLKRHYFACIC